MSAPGARPTVKVLYRDGERFVRIRMRNKWIEVHERHHEKLIDELIAVRAPEPESVPANQQKLPL